MKNWTIDSVREVAFATAVEVAQQQTRLGNPPTEFRVDGQAAKPPSKLQNRIDVQFGGADVRPLMNDLMLIASTRVPGVKWGWKVRAGPGAAALEAQLPGSGPVIMAWSDVLYLVPVAGDIAEMPYRNILYMDGLGIDARGRYRKRGTRRKVGFIGQTASAGRARGRPFFHVRAGNSFLHAARAGRVTGQRNYISRRTGKLAFFQGIWFFRIARSVR